MIATQKTADFSSKPDLAMKACRIQRFGPPDVINQEETPRPKPGPGEVLVRVKAAGVGLWDAWIRAGKSALGQRLPLTLGSDLAGAVEALGDGVTGFERGDAIYGVTNKSFIGAYAEYAVADAGMIARKPSKLSDIEAASVPVVAITAWQALFDQGGAKEGQKILIHGAAGSVGTYAVRFARAANARVIATAGADDLEFVRQLGADEVIDYRARRFEDEVRDVDLVVDLVGGETQLRSFAVLRPGGVMVSAVSAPDQKLAERHAVRATFFYVDVSTRGLAELAKRIDGGGLAPDIGAVLTLSRARLAHEMLEGVRERPRGKIVLWVRD